MYKILLTALFFFAIHLSAEEMYLRDNLKLAKVGDFIVTSQNKTYTLLLIDEITNNTISIEEISVPTARVNLKSLSWKDWIAQDGPGNTSWVRYVIDTDNGEMKEYYSYTKNGYYTLPESENFLSTLLNIKLKSVPENQRKKVGPRAPSQAGDRRPYWQPKLVFEGQVIPGIAFDAWKTFWPKDGSDLSGKIIEIYVPRNRGEYPAYFPYWLQVSGVIGKAKVHIIDSGRNAQGKYNRTAPASA